MNNKRTLVTGASSGIGEALARRFAEKGHDLVITARRKERLDDLAEELGRTVDVQIVAEDLAAPGGVDKLLTEISRRKLTIDILVNNAGMAYSGPFAELEDTQIDNLLSLNIGSLTRLTHQVLPGMIDRGYGRVLNVASVAAFQPVPSLALYAASKAFVLSLTEALAEELQGTGVTITALCPGLTKTEMVDEFPGPEHIPSFMMASAESVAREGYNATMQAEVIRVPGVANLAAVTWGRYQPRWLVRNLGGAFARLNARRA